MDASYRLKMLSTKNRNHGERTYEAIRSIKMYSLRVLNLSVAGDQVAFDDVVVNLIYRLILFSLKNRKFGCYLYFYFQEYYNACLCNNDRRKELGHKKPLI